MQSYLPGTETRLGRRHHEPWIHLHSIQLATMENTIQINATKARPNASNFSPRSAADLNKVSADPSWLVQTLDMWYVMLIMLLFSS